MSESPSICQADGHEGAESLLTVATGTLDEITARRLSILGQPAPYTYQDWVIDTRY